ncbi:LAFA_0C02124g1_1 [Lachancea sp. 'fantastica']|nr:LAFA_0C02124g1_1 [Lachancea sp. 'fantastica']
MTIIRRLYVGDVIEEHNESLAELKPRFERFGRCLNDGFESHGHFAYISMEFKDENAFLKLKSSLNGVRFKRNVLRIDLAKPSWQELRETQQEEDKLIDAKKEKQLLKQQWEYYKKIENIKMSWTDRQQILNGRMRQNPRPKSQLRNATFRIMQNDGHLKVYKCYKNKLWGYERNKQPQDLVARFTQQRHWRDGTGHIVDKLDYSRASSWNKRALQEPLQDQNNAEKMSDAEDVVPDKTHDVLEDLLGGFDFDKPLQLQEDEDLDDGEEKSLPSRSEHKQDENVEAEPEPHMPEEEPESEDEFVPTFGGETAKPEVNNVENLRSLFNPDEAEKSTFKVLGEPNDDIDMEKTTPQHTKASEAVLDDAVDDTSDIPVRATAKGLFFPHFSSPFLHSQSQLAKLKTSSELGELFADWDTNFWENRAAWTKEMKRRKRDAIRQYRKKNSKSKGNGILV